MPDASSPPLQSSPKIIFKLRDPETGTTKTLSSNDAPSDVNDRKRKAETSIKRPAKKIVVQHGEQPQTVEATGIVAQQSTDSAPPPVKRKRTRRSHKCGGKRNRLECIHRPRQDLHLPVLIMAKYVLPFYGKDRYYSNRLLMVNRNLREAALLEMDVNELNVPELYEIYKRHCTVMPIVPSIESHQTQFLCDVRFGQRVLSDMSLMRVKMWARVLQTPPDQLPEQNLKITDQRVAMSAVTRNPMLLRDVCDTIRTSRPVVQRALTLNGLALQYATLEQRSNLNIVSFALQQNGLALQYASEDLRKNLAACKQAITRDPEAWEFVHSSMQTDPTLLSHYRMIGANDDRKTFRKNVLDEVQSSMLESPWQREKPLPQTAYLNEIYDNMEIETGSIPATSTATRPNGITATSVRPPSSSNQTHHATISTLLPITNNYIRMRDPNAFENALLNYNMTEPQLRDIIDICIKHLVLDHMRETLSRLVRPLRYCATVQSLRDTIEGRMKDLTHFWNSLQNNEGLLRQRYVVEWIVLAGIFYLCQAYKQRKLSVCDPEFEKHMWRANVDAFIRFRLLDWHTEELIVSEHVRFFVHHPRHSKEIISSVLNLIDGRSLRWGAPGFIGTPTSIFPNPVEALCTCKIDDFYLRCLLTFSACTQEMNLVDIPLLTPMTRLLTFEEQLHVLSKDSFLYESNLAQKHRYKLVPETGEFVGVSLVRQKQTGSAESSTQNGSTAATLPIAQDGHSNAAAQSIDGSSTVHPKIYSFPALRKQFLTRISTAQGKILFPPTRHVWSHQEKDLSHLLVEKHNELQFKAKELEQLSRVESPQQERFEEEGFNIVCCIDGCTRLAAEDLNSHELVYYDDLFGTYALKAEHDEDPTKLRLVCKSHQQIDERQFNYGVAPITESRLTLSELVMRNALQKLPDLMRERFIEQVEQHDDLDDDRKLHSIVDELQTLEGEQEPAEDETSAPEGPTDENSLLVVLMEYICRERPQFADEINFLKTVEWYTTEQLVSMCTEVARIIQEEDADYDEGANVSHPPLDTQPDHQLTLLQRITHEACELLPHHANFLRCIAVSVLLPILRDYVTFRYFLLLNVIRFVKQPLSIRKPDMLMKILRYGQMDEIMDQMIQNYVVGEHAVGEELDRKDAAQPSADQ